MPGLTRSYPNFNLQIVLLAGAAADTNIAVTGIKTTDHIIFCGVLATAAAIATLADITSEVAILTDGNIQLSDTDTTNNQLWLWWHRNDL